MPRHRRSSRRPERVIVAPIATDPATAPVCDFCNETVPADRLVLFPCRTFERRSVVRERDLLTEVCSCHQTDLVVRPDEHVLVEPIIGGWAACPDCRPFLEASDMDGLRDHAVTTIGASGAPVIPVAIVATLAEAAGRIDPGDRAASLRAMVESSHLGYWLHREPTPPEAFTQNGHER